MFYLIIILISDINSIIPPKVLCYGLKSVTAVLLAKKFQLKSLSQDTRKIYLFTPMYNGYTITVYPP